MGNRRKRQRPEGARENRTTQRRLRPSLLWVGVAFPFFSFGWVLSLLLICVGVVVLPSLGVALLSSVGWCCLLEAGVCILEFKFVVVAMSGPGWDAWEGDPLQNLETLKPCRKSVT